MPLSEYEQRVLAQMEQQLRDADPELVQSLGEPGPIVDVRRLSMGILIILVGIGMLVAGVALPQTLLGVLGFVGMLIGALYAFSKGKASREVSAGDAPTPPKTPRPTASAPAKGSFMDRQQERWERRRQGE